MQTRIVDGHISGKQHQMTINLNAFVGSCRPVGDALMAKHQQHHVVSSRCGLPRLRRSPSHQSSRSSSPRADSMSPEKESRSVAIEKRSKQYFFKLLSAARTRDKRLLASTMRSLGADKEYLKQIRTADPKVADPLQVQDVLLKAASRCGQPIFADRVFTVRIVYAVLYTHKVSSGVPNQVGCKVLNVCLCWSVTLN